MLKVFKEKYYRGRVLRLLALPLDMPVVALVAYYCPLTTNSLEFITI
jgi:ABC-type transport system involved in cytochrome c biogenesis permease subunit